MEYFDTKCYMFQKNYNLAADDSDAQWINEEWRKAYLIKTVGGKFQLSEI